MASSMTWVAAKTGGPKVPNVPYLAFAVAAIDASAGIPVMSGPNDDTYEPLIENVPGENRPSVPRDHRVLVLLGEVAAELLSVGG